MKDALPISMKDLKSTTMGCPDYNASVKIDQDNYTVLDNGYIQCYVALYNSGSITINDLKVFMFAEHFTENTGAGGCAVIPVAKGDVVTFSGTFKQRNFIPCK